MNIYCHTNIRIMLKYLLMAFYIICYVHRFCNHNMIKYWERNILPYIFLFQEEIAFADFQLFAFKNQTVDSGP